MSALLSKILDNGVTGLDLIAIESLTDVAKNIKPGQAIVIAHIEGRGLVALLCGSANVRLTPVVEGETQFLNLSLISKITLG